MSTPLQNESSSRVQMDSIPLVKQPKKPQRKICKLPISGSENVNEINLHESLPRFGPFYCKDDSSVCSVKDEAWNHVLKRSPDREAVTTEIYLGAVRRVEEQAREIYADDDTVNNLTGSQFRWMMIKDGCFFLQLALFVLGSSKELGYSSDHEIFGKRADIRGWIKSIFFVGNQIPLVVLRELIKQSFFQEVIAQGKWEQPKVNLCRIVLYRFLMLPELENQQHRGISLTPLKRIFARPQPPPPPPPSDILHGLHLLIIGPEIESDDDDDDDDEEEEEEEEEDLEAQGGGMNQGQVARLGPILPIADDDEFLVIENIKDRKFSSAAKLRQAGIHFKLVEEKGSRGINFTKNMFRASLTLPPFFVDEFTKIMFRSLKDYETIQPLCQNEVRSYLRFMSELIRTPEDAKQLAKKEIIRGRQKHKDKLSDILGRLAPRDLYNPHFSLVKVKVNDYSRPPWAYLKKYVEFVVFLTLIQTLYAMLSYHHSKN